MTDTTHKLATSVVSVKNLSAPSLKNRLQISIFVIVLPLFLLAGSGFFFFQKTTNSFNHAIEDIVLDVIPVTELKDKIQQTVIPFNHYLRNQQLDDKNKFLQLSNEIKKSLVNPIKSEQHDNSLAEDIYHSAYLNWRNAHRIAVKIFSQIDNHEAHISHDLLQDFYQHVIKTTLALDKLHLAMQERVKIRFQQAKALKFDALFLISFVFLLVYISTLSTIIFLNRSIMKPIQKLEQWAHNFSRCKKPVPLKLHSYREFEYIASTYNKLSQLVHDDQTILKKLSRKDELTQLNNRRCFLNQLQDEHNRHQRYNTRYSLLLIDIDHMSSVSQNYGKHVCDLTLIQISKMLETAIRPTDFLARYGSDEFIIILPEVEAHGANITAERIRNAISEYVFKINEFKFGVTVSIGFSLIQEKQPLLGVLNCVDSALQLAKLAGRNQVQFCDSDKPLSDKFQEKYLKESDLKLS
ncbi:MAG: diguanylate cyclase [Gammaproteobacteria bacterium]|nr:diguanylate cyclase [Gammaproteobacteria bacterium]